jgi:DNA-binding response OmpR family regulator
MFFSYSGSAISYLINIGMSKKILFVNNRAAVSFIPGILTEAGYNVDVVFSPDEVLRTPDAPDYDLIVLLANPEAECWIACDWIRRSTEAPLIVISTNASVETCVRAINAGADYFMRKPFGPLELLARINSLVARTTNREPMSIAS